MPQITKLTRIIEEERIAKEVMIKSKNEEIKALESKIKTYLLEQNEVKFNLVTSIEYQDN